MDIPLSEVLVLLGVAAVVTALLVLEPVLRVPYPILLVLGGLALSQVPIVPDFSLPPDLVLLAFLPPLVFGSAFELSIQDLRANAASISLLAVGLVIATAVAVAAVAHEVAELPWASAFVLGAVVSPTDPIAASEVARRLGLPRRVVSVIEGESLVNDASGLIVYRFAVAAVLTGAFSLWEAGLTFLWTAAGGIAIGLAAAWVVRLVRRRLDNPQAEIVVSLLVPYFAYLPAEAVQTSGVLAAVAAGLYLAWYSSEIAGARARLGQAAVWSTLLFVLNAILFALIGLQLSQIVEDTAGTPLGEILKDAGAVLGVLLAVRFCWVFASSRIPRLAIGQSWREPLLLSWAGIRGAVSLAAALAIPFVTDAGDPFPGRSIIIVTTFAIILATLVLQGLSFPLVIRFTGLHASGAEEQLAEAAARLQTTDAALGRLDELVEAGEVDADMAERIRTTYEIRQRRLTTRAVGAGADGATPADFARVSRELIEAERRELHSLHRAGEVSDELMRRIEHDLDIEETHIR